MTLGTSLFLGSFVPAVVTAQTEAVTAESEAADPIDTEVTVNKTPGQGSDSFIQVQLQTIHISFIDIRHYETIKQVQEQMYSIPGVTNFIPYRETKGLLTYDLRYSGGAKLLQKALQDTLTERFEVGVKESMGNFWEFTIRKL
jgi:hypothetical protein